MGIILKVPNELNHSFFFPNDVLILEDEITLEFKSTIPFVYDIGFYNGLTMQRPWENPEKAIPFLLEEWNKLRTQLETFFSERDFSLVMVPMKQAIALFIEMLFWTNRQPVHFPLDHIHKLDIKPVNIQERIEFILSRPKLYHSFAQVSELFIEQEKHFTKMVLLKNKKNVQES
jgi:hypothetical protein